MRNKYSILGLDNWWAGQRCGNFLAVVLRECSSLAAFHVPVLSRQNEVAAQKSEEREWVGIKLRMVGEIEGRGEVDTSVCSIWSLNGKFILIRIKGHLPSTFLFRKIYRRVNRRERVCRRVIKLVGLSSLMNCQLSRAGRARKETEMPPSALGHQEIAGGDRGGTGGPSKFCAY